MFRFAIFAALALSTQNDVTNVLARSHTPRTVQSHNSYSHHSRHSSTPTPHTSSNNILHTLEEEIDELTDVVEQIEEQFQHTAHPQRDHHQHHHHHHHHHHIPVQLHHKHRQSHDVSHRDVNGHLTRIKYSVTPTEHVYHFHNDHNIQNINCIEDDDNDRIDIYLKRSGQSLLSIDINGTLHSDSKFIPTFLPAGSILVFELPHNCGSGESNEFHSHNLIRRLHHSLQIDDINEDQHQIQIQAKESSWKSCFDEGSIEYAADNINSILPTSIIPTSTTSTSTTTPLPRSPHHLASADASDLSDESDWGFNPFDEAKKAAAAIAEQARIAKEKADQVAQEAADASARTTAEATKRAAETAAIAAAESAKRAAEAAARTAEAARQAAELTKYAATVPGKTFEQLKTIYGDGSQVIPVEAITGWNNQGSNAPKVSSMLLYENELMTISCENCYLGVTLGLQVTVTWAVTDTRKDGGAVTATVTAPAHINLVAQLKQGKHFSFTKHIVTIPILTQRLLFTLGPVPIIAGCNMDVSVVGTVDLHHNAVVRLSQVGFDAKLTVSRGIKFGSTPNSAVTTEDETKKKFDFQLLQPAFKYEKLTAVSATGQLGIKVDFNIQIEALTQLTLSVTPYVGLEADLNVRSGREINCPRVTDNTHLVLTPGVKLGVSGAIHIDIEIWKEHYPVYEHAFPDIGPWAQKPVCLANPELSSQSQVRT